jgi:hypothetical protein
MLQYRVICILALQVHCFIAVMTRVVCRQFRWIESFDHHGPSHILFVVKII